MYHCPDHPDAVMWRSGPDTFSCVLCRRTETEDFLRGPLTKVHAFLVAGGRLTPDDRCQNHRCTSTQWRFVDDDPLLGRSSRRCVAGHCDADWPEVPWPVDKCFWCGSDRAFRAPRYDRPTILCYGCGRTWRGPGHPAPFMQRFYGGDRPWANDAYSMPRWTEYLDGRPAPERRFPWIDMCFGDG